MVCSSIIILYSAENWLLSFRPFHINCSKKCISSLGKKLMQFDGCLVGVLSYGMLSSQVGWGSGLLSQKRVFELRKILLFFSQSWHLVCVSFSRFLPSNCIKKIVLDLICTFQNSHTVCSNLLALVIIYYSLCIYSSNNNDQTFKTKIAQSTNATATTSVVDKQGSYETNNSQSIVEIKSRPLQRVGSDCGEGYFIDDRSEININFQKYRMVFVVNKDAVFYKKSAFRQAKKVRIN